MAPVASVRGEVKAGIAAIDALGVPEDEIVEDRSAQERAPLKLLGHGVRFGNDGRFVLVHEVGKGRGLVEAEVRGLLDRGLSELPVRRRRQLELTELPAGEQ